jgi:hypothetical protein
MKMPERQYTSYQARTFWYMKFFGLPKPVQSTMMEDGKTKLGVMEFVATEDEGLARPHWTYATNGMSERRMPCQEEPHGDPRHRIELIAYSDVEAPWIVQLLSEMACYPFVHHSGFAANHTIPVTDSRPHLWDGYVMLTPPIEPEEFSPLAVDIGIGDDWVFYLQVIGLKLRELDFAIKYGGQRFSQEYVVSHGSPDEIRRFLLLDKQRESLL